MSEVEVRDDGKNVLHVDLPEDASQDERLKAAHYLRTMGMSWRQIAEQLGFSGAGSVRVDVRRWLQTTGARVDEEVRRDALDLELERLDELVLTYMPLALAGAERAADVVLKTIAMRSKLLGFEELHKDKETGTQRTVIIPMEEGQYAARLKELVEGEQR